MDPTMFRIDWDVLAEVMITIIVLSFFIERALALVFEHRLFINNLKDRGFKEPIAFFLSFAVVKAWEFDALSVMLKQDTMTLWGFVVTAAVIAGGSKASIALFHNLLNTKSSAQRAVDAEKASAAAR